LQSTAGIQPSAAGSLYSTAEDLARWTQALFDGKLLSAQSLQKMTRPLKSNYAYGLRGGNVSERLMYEHPGAIDGFNSAIMYFPESRTAVVVLANVNGDAPVTIANRLARMAHGEAVLLPTERTANYADTMCSGPLCGCLRRGTDRASQLRSRAIGCKSPLPNASPLRYSPSLKQSFSREIVMCSSSLSSTTAESGSRSW
jgi:CubicO group peptidase (beta-lactamase class C family)